ncbi:hypothetical protein V6N11_059909 [Hibiscus sabdariffa]|uniref:Uncharacterized protein n=2 Tax=Hibiscus sabdariffa TaxID=183260 RepID=A0ABR2NYI7_9ROSI
MDKQQQQMSLAKSSRQRCNEWIFKDVPSDITIEVNGGTFALHKFPLVSRSRRIRNLVAEHRDSDVSKVELMNLPGGVESFELAAKFCYGINFEITSLNVAQLRCVSDYLEMTEEFSKDNLGSRAEEYLESIVCRNLAMCVEVLQQCENLLPLADDLKIVGRCVDAIASKACVEQIAVIIAMKCRGVRPESIGASLVNYTQKELTKKVDSVWTNYERVVVETVISLLPIEKLAAPVSFLFGLLRSAVMLDCTIACRLDLERRIGSQLDIATLDDLLIPSFRNGCETLFDVDMVHRILVIFSQQDDCVDDMNDVSVFESDSPHWLSQSALLKVSKLVDNYLAEIAPDANVKLAQFMAIAEALPAHARTIHDGLYRAIDMYLRAHQGILEADKKKLCKLVDFQKLSQEAGTHAAQNERLPLQSMIQVLYFEQLRLRNALCCSYADEDRKSVHQHQSWRISTGAFSAALSLRDNYASLRQENRELKLEVSRIRMRLNDLEKEHIYMKRNMEKSHSRKFMSSFSRKIDKIRFFRHCSSTGSSSPSSPSRQSRRTDSKVIQRTCANQ